MLPFLVRHSARKITHYQVKSDGKTSCERLHERPYQEQMAEFAEVVHFRDPGKAADMPKLDDRWNLGLWLGKSLASDEHYVGTSAGVRRCRSIWRRPEIQRWDRWNPTAHHQDKPPQVRGVSHWNLKSSTEERNVVRHASDMQRCIRWNAWHDSRTLWTMKLHRQQLRVQVNQTSRCHNRQRLAPRPARVEDWCRLCADPRRRMPTWKLQRA